MSSNNIHEAADRERITTAIVAARSLAEEVRESMDEVSTGDKRDNAKLATGGGTRIELSKDRGEQEHERDAASDREAVSKRHRKGEVTVEAVVSTPLSREQLLLDVMAVMKDAYGALPKAFWGLSHAADILAPRGLQVNTSSLEVYRWQFANQSGYPVVAVSINKPFTIIPGVKTVFLGESFDSYVMLKEGIEELTFSPYSKFNHRIRLPPGLKKVVFGQRFSRPVILPPGLVELAFSTPTDFDPPIPDDEASSDFDQPITLPPSVRIAKFGDGFAQPLTLPTLLEELEFGSNFDKPIDLRGLSKLRVLRFGAVFDEPVDLTDLSNLRILSFGNDFKQPLTLPSRLEELDVGHDFCHPLTLPPHLKRLRLGDSFEHPISLHEGLEDVCFGTGFCSPITLPSTL